MCENVLKRSSSTALVEYLLNLVCGFYEISTNFNVAIAFKLLSNDTSRKLEYARIAKYLLLCSMN